MGERCRPSAGGAKVARASRGGSYLCPLWERDTDLQILQVVGKLVSEKVVGR